MSTHNIEVNAGTTVRLPTAGKYCDRDIVITATGGADGQELIDSLINGTITSIESNVLTIANSAFRSVNTLTTASFPLATTLNPYAFQSCKNLISLSIPSATYIAGYALPSCEKLPSIKLPNVTSVGIYAFQRCYSLHTVDFGSKCSLPNKVFDQCTSFKNLILRSTSGLSVLDNPSALDATQIESGTGYIYVPSSMINDYKVASNWSTYANQFRALEDYTVDGTITGALDESKI